MGSLIFFHGNLYKAYRNILLLKKRKWNLPNLLCLPKFNLGRLVTFLFSHFYTMFKMVSYWSKEVMTVWLDVGMKWLVLSLSRHFKYTLKSWACPASKRLGLFWVLVFAHCLLLVWEPSSFCLGRIELLASCEKRDTTLCYLPCMPYWRTDRQCQIVQANGIGKKRKKTFQLKLQKLL